ncbi:hypothetical protein [Proteinivorax tanatarense]|uniref:hypothetical protein n=1 Tax=Proteinivorax tanatarense TaxID=1260629 RepID=UPI003D9C7896
MNVMIQNQQSMNLSSYMDIYNLVVPKDNVFRKINDMIDFSFVYSELKINTATITVEKLSERLVSFCRR